MELKLPVADSGAWPPIKIQGASPACAKAMLQNGSGRVSEMTSISFYLYGAVVQQEGYPKVAEYFHKIAIVEMGHLNIFLKLAQLLGADPRLWSYINERSVYWDPSWIPYTRELPLLLNRAIIEENKAISNYRRQIAELSDPYIKEILQRMIADEEKHIDIFRRLFREYCGDRRQGNLPGT